MVFNSFDFISFFFVVWCATVVVTRFTKLVSIRNICLLLASYYFYGSFNIAFLAILAYVTGVNYVGGLCLKRVRQDKTVVSIIILLTLLPLITFKYSAFLIYDVLGLSQSADNDWITHLILPVGISFFTFQALSYTIDLYRNKVSPCRNIIEFALFVAFFPTILSGPIEKARHLLPQLRRVNSIHERDLMMGCSYFVWGVFKKCVVADRLANYVDWAYSSVDYVPGGTLALAAIFYSIQIYCDFSGYSDMAIGAARCLGFNLSPNFCFPYFSTRIKDFWKKWHISLTTWFTEYVYFSLGGNRVKLKIHWVFNISMVFLLSGIWHGAAWNFLIWGATHAILYLCEYYAGLHRKDFLYKHWIYKAIAGIVVFILVTVAWMFFRIDDVTVVIRILTKICINGILSIVPGASTVTFAINMMMLAFFGVFEIFLYRNRREGDAIISHHITLQVAWTLSLLLLTALFGMSNDNFVYFQF